MTVSTKAAISTPENHKPLEALDIIDRVIHSLLRAYAPKLYYIYDQYPDFSSPETTYRQSGLFQIRFKFVEQRTLTVFFNCDSDYKDYSPSGAIGISLGDSGLSRPLIQAIALALSVFGTAYYKPTDSQDEYHPLTTPQPSILDLVHANLLHGSAYTFSQWAEYWQTHLANTPDARPLHQFLGVAANTDISSIKTNSDFQELLTNTPSTLPTALSNLYAECAKIAQVGDFTPA